MDNSKFHRVNEVCPLMEEGWNFLLINPISLSRLREAKYPVAT
jgi:hypothetical protein